MTVEYAARYTATDNHPYPSVVVTPQYSDDWFDSPDDPELLKHISAFTSDGSDIWTVEIVERDKPVEPEIRLYRKPLPTTRGSIISTKDDGWLVLSYDSGGNGGMDGEYWNRVDDVQDGYVISYLQRIDWELIFDASTV